MIAAANLPAERVAGPIAGLALAGDHPKAAADSARAGRAERKLGKIFTAALLLSGSSSRAEAAILQAMESLEADGAGCDQLHRRAIAAAVRAERGPAAVDAADLRLLPDWLHPLLLLPARPRMCFVLRFLESMDRGECAALLRMSGGEVDEFSSAAAAGIAGAPAA